MESKQCRVKIKKKDCVEARRESLQGGGDLLQLSYLANRHLCEIAGYSDSFQMGMRHGRCLTKASFFLVVGMGMERMPG